MVGYQDDRPLVAVLDPSGESAAAVYFDQHGEPVLLVVDDQGVARVGVKLNGGVPIVITFDDDAQPVQVRSVFDPPATLADLVPSPN